MVAVQKWRQIMSDLWNYTEACDGDFCPMDCDKCNKEEDEDDNSMLSLLQSRKDGADLLPSAPHLSGKEQTGIR